MAFEHDLDNSGNYRGNTSHCQPDVRGTVRTEAVRRVPLIA